MSNTTSSGYQVLYRSGRGHGEARGAAEVELKAVILDGDPGMESESEAEREEGGGKRGPEDAQSLISEEPEIDEAGEARDYEVALKHAGFGLFHVILMCMNGVALASDAVEVRGTRLREVSHERGSIQGERNVKILGTRLLSCMAPVYSLYRHTNTNVLAILFLTAAIACICTADLPAGGVCHL